MKSKLFLSSVLVLVVFFLATVMASQSVSASAIGEDDSLIGHSTSSTGRMNQLAPTAVITVGGTINTDTIWTCGNVYYVYSQDVTVVSGVTLTIEPCVIVKFQNNRRLIVTGKLTVAGTVGQPVYFTSYRDDTIGGTLTGAARAPAQLVIGAGSSSPRPATTIR
jgi:hypothetical protein